ncbi:HAMP domain-containing protein [Chromobacterium sphagni]|uniref:Chemotaxis protein CheA n=1 Tax=Chromobacterium sphagni TaxID=1903179 RepID=A0A1S1X291_9NEIS|nr:HAMP domain-containing protein [Chromobacterium sphagni]OHX13296.1 chemotaxis protein CheA [Chromobacterium sphagni]OHX17006.1 chemotaxis protein CheA [Chromobacterium sphagni]
MNIRNRILLLVSVSFLSILAIGAYAVWKSDANAAAVKSVTEGEVPSALASADLIAALKDVQLATMSALQTGDAGLQAQAREQLAARERALRAQLALQKKMASNTVQSGLVSQAQDVFDSYLGSIDDAIQFKQSGQNDLADATYAGGVLQYHDNLQQIVTTLRVEKNRSKDDAILTLNRSLSGAAATLASVTVAALLLLGGLGWLLYRQIVGPIRSMQATMSDIADRQDFSRRVPVEREDEVGKSIVAFNRMVARIEESSALLRQKSGDIQAMLQNIPQGILTIVDGLAVHQEYSAHLETILETRDIAGRNLIELLFADCRLGADQLSQLEAAIASCLGEDSMNFEFNQHLLAGELEKRCADGRVKILDLNWSIIADEHGRVERLMLCVRDVTELKALAAEANEQKRELAVIGEILAVSQDKFHDFITSSIRFVGDNEQLIRQHPRGDAEAINQLFRNMHTIKGNARTYGLSQLTNIVHLAEQSYQQLRQPQPAIAWDQTQLLEELESVRDGVEHYARVNEVSLGRKGPGRAGGGDYLLVDREQIRETLQRLETVNTGNLHELIAVHNSVRGVLNRMGTEPVGEILSGVLESLPSLARELGKAEPQVRIRDHGYVLRNQISATLKNAFMHLMRNSLDHGLEAVDERQALGKPARGSIALDLTVADGRLELSLTDDGRGLALGRIRERAERQGWITDSAGLSDEEVAQLIFRPGFSTAAQITEVSGRGVGMDAVQSFIKREHGRIELRFLDEERGMDFRRFATVVILPDSCAVPMEPRAVAPLGVVDASLV